MARMMGKMGDGTEVGARVARHQQAIAKVAGRDCAARWASRGLPMAAQPPEAARFGFGASQVVAEEDDGSDVLDLDA